MGTGCLVASVCGVGIGNVDVLRRGAAERAFGFADVGNETSLAELVNASGDVSHPCDK